MNKNNAFFFTPGGYGPFGHLEFWGEHLDVLGEVGTEEYDDNLSDAVYEYTTPADVDYGCYFISRDEVQKLIKQLQAILEEENE